VRTNIIIRGKKAILANAPLNIFKSSLALLFQGHLRKVDGENIELKPSLRRDIDSLRWYSFTIAMWGFEVRGASKSK